MARKSCFDELTDVQKAAIEDLLDSDVLNRHLNMLDWVDDVLLDEDVKELWEELPVHVSSILVRKKQLTQLLKNILKSLNYERDETI